MPLYSELILKDTVGLTPLLKQDILESACYDYFVYIQNNRLKAFFKSNQKYTQTL